MDDPYMIPVVDGHAGDLSQNPVIRQIPYPERIYSEAGDVRWGASWLGNGQRSLCFALPIRVGAGQR